MVRRSNPKVIKIVRQQENFLVLMENYQTALKYTETALNSNGVAMSKFQSYQDSLEASQKRLTAQFEDFSQTVLDSGLVKGTFDAGSGILGLFTELIDTIGVIPTILSGISIGSSISGKTGGERLIRPFYRRLYMQYNGEKVA